MTTNLTEIQNLIVVLSTDQSKYDRGISKATTMTDKFTSTAKIAAGILVRDMVQGFTNAAISSLKLGARMTTIQRSFELMRAPGGNVTSTLEEMKDATEGMVSEMDLLTQANTAMALGLPTEDLDQLFAAAIKVGKAMGLDAKFAVESLTTGIGRQSRLVLDNLGIIVKAEDAYKEFAERIGKTTEELTENERKTAFMTIAIEKVTDKAAILGDNISETEKQTERWNATIKNATTSVGKFLQPLGALAPIFERLSPAISLMAVQVLPAYIGKIGAAIKGTTTWGLVTAATSKLITTSILGIPIIGWAAAATLAITGLIIAYNNWKNATDTVKEAELELSEAMGNLTRELEEQEIATDAVTRAQEAATTANEAAETQLDAVARAQDALNASKERTVDAEEKVKAAQDAYTLALQHSEAVAQDGINTFLYLAGAVDELSLSTDKTTWSSDILRRAFSMTSEELQVLQGEVNATTDALNGLQDTMTPLNDEQEDLNLQLMRLDDAFKDGTLSQEEYEEQSEVIRARLRDIRIAQAELRIEIRDTTRVLEEQAAELAESQSTADQLVEADEALGEAMEAVDKASADLEGAQEELGDRMEEEKDLLEDVTTEWEKYQGLLDTASEAAVAAAEAESELAEALEDVADATDAVNEAEKRLAEEREKRDAEKATPPPQGTIPGPDFEIPGDFDFAGGFAKGGTFSVQRPTVFTAGEKGPETVSVSRGSEAPMAGGGSQIIFKIGTFIGLNQESARMLAQATAREHIRELERRGIRT